MERYLHQLIDDIRYAKANVPAPWRSFETEEAPFSWMEDPQTAPQKSLEEWTGLKKVQLPPASFLTERQLHILLEELKDMLSEYNCHVVFQGLVPEELQYEVIRKRFDQQSPMLMSNMHFFEFCDSSQSMGQCHLGEYCHCRFFESLLTDYEEDGIDLETGHDFPFEGEGYATDPFGAGTPFFDDYEDLDDLDDFDWDEDEDDWNIF